MQALVDRAMGGEKANVRLRLFSKDSVEGPRIGKEAIAETVKEFGPDRVFVCGPEAFEKAVMDGLESAGVKPDEVVREKFNY